MNPTPHHAAMYHLPEVAHGRFNLNPAPMLAGVVDASGLKGSKPMIEGLVVDARPKPSIGKINLTTVKDVPATKVPLGMVRLEMH
jgi:hypothetical protein